MKPVTASLRAPCEPGELFRWVDDLSHYPRWLDLVRRAEPLAVGEGAGEPTWTVVLAAQIGPLRRSKQLTMVRTVLEEGRRARFERREPDGRDHAAWVLQAEVRALTPDEAAGLSGVSAGAVPARSELTMTMHYDGQWWAPLVERVLVEQIDRARPRLLALVGG
ncbi:MAG: SRPBCC family protein [Acidimicrobiia bacterium]